MEKFVLILLLATAALAQQNPPQFHRAIAKLSDPTGSDVTGNVTFTQLPNGTVQVEGVVTGLAQGQYGFHVHEKGDITGGCMSTGGHFNPEHKNHGHPDDLDRHVGDLGNLEFDEDKIGNVNIIDNKISLFGPNCILGRAVVLHQKADDYGKGGNADSRKTGNAGGRVACGVIGILDPVYGWKTNEASPSSIVAAILIPISTLLLLIN